MNFFDRLAAAITPEATDEDRINARNEAQALAQDDDWLGSVLDQHEQIETLFAEAALAQPGDDRVAAMKKLGQLLTAHSMAEEVVLYPAIARIGEKGDATMAYEEQSMAKVEMAGLEQLDPESDEWAQKLEAIRKAVAHHVYEEESDWFPKLHRSISESEADMLSMRFDEEFDRHGDVGMGSAHVRPASQPGPATGGYTN
ncbi:hemerythrin domain-containing protein [Novosphingobium ginsenosidimutans]|nr:hemerythrin domain-containing protein [Novosphingobium ginsenosidimutans]